MINGVEMIFKVPNMKLKRMTMTVYVTLGGII